MTEDEVRKIIQLQTREDPGSVNDHGITLQQALVPPRKIAVVVQMVRNGAIKEHNEEVWLVGRERLDHGYSIIMRDDGQQFGLASDGFFVGWYGSLKSAFAGM